MIGAARGMRRMAEAALVLDFGQPPGRPFAADVDTAVLMLGTALGPGFTSIRKAAVALHPILP